MLMMLALGFVNSVAESIQSLDRTATSDRREALKGDPGDDDAADDASIIGSSCYACCDFKGHNSCEYKSILKSR